MRKILLTIVLLMAPGISEAVDRYEQISWPESADSAKWFVYWVNSSVIQDSTAVAARASVTNYDTTFSLNTDDTAYSLVLRIWYAGADDYGTYKVSVARDSVAVRSLGTDAITATVIAANAIGASEIATNAIGSSELNTNAIGADQIASNAIDADAIASNAIGASEFAASAVTEIMDSLFGTRIDADTATNSYFGSLLNDLTAIRDSLQFLITSSGDTSLHGPEIIATIDSMYDSLGFYPDVFATNLVRNPGFERDSVGGAAPAFWTQGTGTHTLDETQTSLVGGRWQYKIIPAGGEHSFIYQNVGTLPAGHYWLSGTMGNFNSLRSFIVIDNAIPTFTSAHIDSIQSVGANSILEHGKIITLSAATDVFVGIRVSLSVASDTGWFDNIKLIPLGFDTAAYQGAASSVDSGLISNIMHRVGWGTPRGSGSDSSTLAERDATASASASDTANIRNMILGNFNLTPAHGKIRFIDVDGSDADGLTIATAWTDFTNGVGDTADYTYYVMPGTYSDPVITITASNVTLEAVDYGSVLMRNTDSAWNNTMIQVNDSDDAGPIYTANISNIKIKGFDLAYTQMGGLPADPKFQAAIWVFDSSYNVEISHNTFGLDSTFKAIAIEDVSAYNYVHDNRFFRAHTHAIDAACDYSIFEHNFIMDQRDYLGGPSGANSTEPIQITSKGNHNIVNGNYITSGSVLIRVQGDTNLVADNYLGKTTFDDGREMMGYINVGVDTARGNVFAGNWAHAHNADTSGLAAGEKSIDVIRDLTMLNHDQFDTLTALHGSGSWTTGGGGSGSNTVIICAQDTSVTPDSVRSDMKVTVRTISGTLVGAQFTDASGCTPWALDSDSFVVLIRGGGYIGNPRDTIVVATDPDSFNIPIYPVPTNASAAANVCNVYGYINDYKDDGVQYVTVTATLTSNKKRYNTCDSTLVLLNVPQDETDGTGRFDIPLIYSSCLSGEKWTFTITHPDGYSYTISDSIPDSTSYRIIWSN